MVTTGDKILRFRSSERWIHWTIAVPFLVCFTTALILVVIYNPDPNRPYRAVLSWIHRISGICLIVLPILAVLRARGDFRIHFYNVRQAWIWTLSDVKWLALTGVAAFSKRIRLPEQGKFNAGEKLNFMMVMSTWPLYTVTGILMWLPGIAFFSWILHVAMALVAVPFILGHIFMATINPDTRQGLRGMITGFVDRRWAKHHYGDWYREHFEQPEPRPRTRTSVTVTVSLEPVASSHRPNDDSGGRRKCQGYPMAQRVHVAEEDSGVVHRPTPHADPADPATEGRPSLVVRASSRSRTSSPVEGEAHRKQQPVQTVER